MGDHQTDMKMDTGTQQVQVYRYRWVVLLLAGLVNFISFAQFLEFSIVGDVIKKYYDVGSIVFDMTAVIPFVIYLVMFPGLSYLMEKYSLRVSVISAISVTLAGNIIKIFCNDPSRLYIIVLGQILCGVGQVYGITIPTQLASIWFGSHEVSTACGILLLALQLGQAIGCVIPPFLVKDSDNIEDIADGLFQLTLYNAILTGIIAILVIIFFRAKPACPPSISQLNLLEEPEEKVSYIKHCKNMLKNRDFLIILISIGNMNGIWNSLGILVNPIYLEYFPDGATDVGIITLLAIISGGCFGSLGFGILLDKTQAYKKISIATGVCSSVLYVLMAFTFLQRYRIATFITVPLLGLFLSSSLVVGFEYTLEVTYPVPESVSTTILNAYIYLVSILFTLILDGLFGLIGYVPTFVVTFFVLALCSLSLFFLSNELRRRDANAARAVQE